MEKQPKLDPKDWVQMSQRQRMSPFPNVLSMEAVTSLMKAYVGESLAGVLVFFKKNDLWVFLDKKSAVHVGKGIVQQIKKQPTLYADLVEREKQLGNALVSFTKAAQEEVNQNTPDSRLAALFTEYAAYYKPVYATYGSVWTMEDFLMEELLGIVAKREKDPMKAANMLNVLTKEPMAMVSTIERRALIKLAKDIAKDEHWADLVQGEEYEAIHTNNELRNLIQNHVEKYFWLTRDYEAPELTFEDIVKKLAEALRGDVHAAYEALEQSMKESEELRAQYTEELKLTEKEQGLFSAMRNAAYLKELRKMYVSQSLSYFDRVLEEIGRRTFLTIKQVRFLHPDDMEQLLVDKEDFTDEVNERYTLSLWHAAKGKTRVITGVEAHELFQEFCAVDESLTEFPGMSVSPGKAQGPVKIAISSDEAIRKVKKGDILLSIQVVPSFSTAIMKAAGLICDGGHGITSHPATLAREAGIPCIIQTRFMREVVKDGDIVEVDADKGIARIIERRSCCVRGLSWLTRIVAL